MHVVVPDGIDDPGRPSGGNHYDRHLIDGLRAEGWLVQAHAVPGTWPTPGPPARARLRRVLAGIDPGEPVLVDGLVASGVAEVLVPESERLAVVPLLHMPGDGPITRSEGKVLRAATAVVTTSAWAHDRVLGLHGLDPTRVHVAEPGVERAELARGTPGGGQLLCVGALAPEKGHDVLLVALGRLAALELGLDWTLVCVGSRDVDPAYVAELAVLGEELGIGDRLWFAGTRTGARLAASYAAADVVVLATRRESYGMVVTEALARGLPVVSTTVGGVPEALGVLPDGRRPGVLVPPDDTGALAAALRRWLERPAWRAELRARARARRETLTGWETTTRAVARVLVEVAR